MAKIFVSYGRREATVLARRLADALEEGKRHEVWLDRDDIAFGERFMSVILPAIDACEAFVFLAGPVSIASEWCRKEIEHAVAARKKLIPVQLATRWPEPLPSGINGLNLIPGPTLDDQASFGVFMTAVDDAIARDSEWYRAHAALLVQATRWLDDGRQGSRLTGAALRAALSLIAAADSGKQPGLTELQREFVADCERLELEETQRLRVLHARGVARQLGARALLLAQRDPGNLDTAALLAAESVERLPTLEAVQLLRDALRLLPIVRLRHHIKGGARALVFSDDGLLLAAAGEDGVAYVWSHDGELRLRVEHGGGPVLQVALPGGRALVSVGADDTVRRTAVRSGKLEDQVKIDRGGKAAVAQDAFVVAEAIGSDVLLHRLDGARRPPLRLMHDQRVSSVWISASGNQLAALTSAPFLPQSSADLNKLSIWRTETAERVELATGFVPEVAFSPDGDSTAVVGVGSGTTVWSAAGERSFELPGRHPTFSADSRWLATSSLRTSADGSKGGSVRVVSVADKGRVIQTFATDRSSDAILMLRDAVVAAGDGRALRIWDAPRGSEVGRTITGAAIKRAAGSPDGRLLATVDESGEVRLHELATYLKDQSTRYIDIVNKVVTSADGAWVARAIGGRHLMSEMSGCATAVLGGRAQIEGGFVDLAVALDGTIAAHVEEQTTISARGSGKVGWDGLVVATTHGEPLMLRRNRRVTAYAVAPDGRLAADADETGEIRITDLRAGRPLPSLQADSAVEGLGFDGTGLVLAFRTKGSIGIADPRAPATVRSIAAVEPRALALSDDGSRLAVCGDDRLTVFATDTLAAVASATSDAGVGELRFLARGEALLSTGRERVELHRSGDLSSVRRFAFDEFIVTCQVAPDERYLAVQGSRMLRAWRLEDGLPIAELPTGPGTSFAFGLEGWLLVANDSRVDRLPLSPELVVKMVRDRIGRPLTPQEWADAVPDEPYVTATATPQT